MGTTRKLCNHANVPCANRPSRGQQPNLGDNGREARGYVRTREPAGDELRYLSSRLAARLMGQLVSYTNGLLGR